MQLVLAKQNVGDQGWFRQTLVRHSWRRSLLEDHPQITVLTGVRACDLLVFGLNVPGAKDLARFIVQALGHGLANFLILCWTGLHGFWKKHYLNPFNVVGNLTANPSGLFQGQPGAGSGLGSRFFAIGSPINVSRYVLQGGQELLQILSGEFFALAAKHPSFQSFVLGLLPLECLLQLQDFYLATSDNAVACFEFVLVVKDSHRRRLNTSNSHAFRSSLDATFCNYFRVILSRLSGSKIRPSSWSFSRPAARNKHPAPSVWRNTKTRCRPSKTP